jgi:hypothetical protein
MGSFSLVHWLIVGALAWFVWKIFSPKRSSGSSPSPSATATVSHRWENDGYREVEVVGELNYQPHLTRLVRAPTDAGVDVDCTALLVPEPSNPYDSNAIRIDIDGGTVGYLSKANAVSFHERLARVGQSGKTTSCPAKIFSGKKTDGTRTPYGVWLEMKRL